MTILTNQNQPPKPSFGPVLPPQDLIKTTKLKKSMLTWYVLTLIMHQKLKEIQEDCVISMEQDDDIETRWEKLCIYRVPHYLQENNKKSYFPKIVSIGPYHYGKEHLLPMEHHKWRGVKMVVKRTKHRIEMYMDAMKELEERARGCYEGTIDLSSEEFVNMLVLDGCFVLELFRGVHEGFLELGYARNDPVFTMRGSMHSIQRDMIMLENQLPLFILSRLLELQIDTTNQTGLVAKLAIQFFNPLMPNDELSTKVANDRFFYPVADKDKEELHFLDILRQSLLQHYLVGPMSWLTRTRRLWKTHVTDKRQQQLIHSATDLRLAGIKLRRRKIDRFWDIKFKNGYLKIPKLLIHDGTKSLFSNLIAFEQCHNDSNNDITSYIIFMHNLIDSEEDVRYLQCYGIIEHWLGNDSEVVDMFKHLCQEVVLDLQSCYLSQLLYQVDLFYNRKWNVVKAALKYKFAFGGIVLLILTLLQTFFTVLAYVKPPS